MSRHGRELMAANGVDHDTRVSTNPQGVRVATPGDIAALNEVVPPIMEENTLLPLSMARVEGLIEYCAAQRSGAIAGIIDGQEGGIAATVGLVRVQDPLSDAAHFYAVWCGLSPEVRKVVKTLPRDDPRNHYGKRLFQFVRWFHSSMEHISGRPVLVRLDVLTKDGLGPKMNWYARNLTQIGASFAVGAAGSFKQQMFPETEIAA